MQFLMDALPLFLLINKLHLFSLTQRICILIQLDTPTCMLHVSACTLVVLRHVITKTIQRKVQYFIVGVLFVRVALNVKTKSVGFCCLRSVPKYLEIHGIYNSLEYNIGS